MRPPSSSKNYKKTSDEDRSKKKKVKSKSSKRRRDPSISSSSSSDSDVDSRSRRKSYKSKKIEKPDKKKKETKKLEKKRSRKKRYRRASSVSSLSSYSSRSCSTCSDLRVSRSPVRKRADRKSSKSKSRSPVRQRPDRKSSKSKSRSPVRQRADRKSSKSKSRSPVRQRADRKSSKSKPRKSERERGRKISRRGDKRGSPSSSACSSRSRGRSPIGERCKEEGEIKRLSSFLAVSRVDDEGKDKIIKAYDDYPTYQNDDIYNEGKKEKDQNKEKDLRDTQNFERVDSPKLGSRRTKEADADHNDGPAKDYIVNKVSRSVRDFDDRYEGSLVCESELVETYTMRNGPEVAIDDSGKEAAELELILRQKALENLRKFRVASKLECNQGSDVCAETSESNQPNSLEEQSHAQGAPSPSELKAMPVPSIATVEKEGNKVHNHSNNSKSCIPSASSTISCKSLNQSKLAEKTLNSISSEETLVAKHADNNRVAARPGSGEAIADEVVVTDRPSFGALNTENEGSKPIKPLMESASGSQFEKKTFSRMRDGETVQVSYKVYIPKKTPALARRQLQR